MANNGISKARGTILLSALLPLLLPVSGILLKVTQKEKPDFSVQARFDFDGDGKPDTFHLEVRKERDFSYNSATKKTSKEKYLWYRSWLKITSGADGRALLEDEWSIIEKDMQSFYLRLGIKSPKEYFDRYFRGLANPNTYSPTRFRVSKLSASEINPDALKYALKQASLPEEDWRKVQEEILSYSEARQIVYWGDWAEDWRWVVYVKSLKQGLHFWFGFPAE